MRGTLQTTGGPTGRTVFNIIGSFSDVDDLTRTSLVEFRTVSAGIFDTVMAIDGNNVGIGTASPLGKLDVNGSIFQRGGVLHADYVFEPDYDLENIEEHAAYMWSNKHLKAVPARRVDPKGLEILEVGAHRRGILEELEKAHIYIERLHHRLKNLEEGNADMEARLAAVEQDRGTSLASFGFGTTGTILGMGLGFVALLWNQRRRNQPGSKL